MEETTKVTMVTNVVGGRDGTFIVRHCFDHDVVDEAGVAKATPSSQRWEVYDPETKLCFPAGSREDANAIQEALNRTLSVYLNRMFNEMNT